MEAFRDCGWMSFVMAFAGFVGIVAAIGSVVVSLLTSRATAPLISGASASLLGLLAMGIAPVAMLHGRSIVDAAVAGPSLDPGARERIRAEGYEEAGQCLDVGGASGVVPFFGGFPAIVVGARRRKRAA